MPHVLVVERKSFLENGGTNEKINPYSVLMWRHKRKTEGDSKIISDDHLNKIMP